MLLLTQVEGIEEHAERTSCSQTGFAPLGLGASLLDQALPLEINDCCEVYKSSIVVNLIQSIDKLLGDVFCLVLNRLLSCANNCLN